MCGHATREDKSISEGNATYKFGDAVGVKRCGDGWTAGEHGSAARDPTPARCCCRNSGCLLPANVPDATTAWSPTLRWFREKSWLEQAFCTF